MSRFDKSNFKRASSNKYEKKKYRLIIHQVEKGDTLFSISRKYNVDIEDLIDQNNIINKTIYIGQNINVKVRD